LRRLVDLSMPVHADMLTFPRVPPPALCVYESHTEFAERIGAAQHGVDSLTASYLVVQNDHVGTHCDARKHIVPDAGGPDTIPLEYCFSDGVLLDFTDREAGDIISAADVEAALARIDYQVKERDIVLIHTGAGAYNTEERYRTDHPGMSAEATRWLIERGVRMMGCDAITFDPPVWAMFEKRKFWEAHRVMWDEEYWHLENLMNLDQIGRPHGFQLSVLPVKWVGTTAAPVRAVAIVED
jgi:kynurenine formamidase